MLSIIHENMRHNILVTIIIAGILLPSFQVLAEEVLISEFVVESNTLDAGRVESEVNSVFLLPETDPIEVMTNNDTITEPVNENVSLANDINDNIEVLQSPFEINENVDPKEMLDPKKLLEDSEVLDNSLDSNESLSTVSSATATSFSSSRSIKPEVDETTGALTYSYPVALPNGVNGMTPKVAINYNSQNSDNDTIVGFGWTLNVPYIARANKQGVDKLYEMEDFVSSEFGELVKVGNEEYRPRVASKYVSIKFANNYWTVTQNDGLVYKYGVDASDRNNDPADANRIYKWMLSDAVDSSGNSIFYDYIKDQGQIYPNKISYGGLYEVNFNYKVRSDINLSHEPNFMITTAKILSGVEIKVNSVVVAKHLLTHIVSTTSKRSLVKEIQLSGLDGDRFMSLPPVKFDYQSSMLGMTESQTYKLPVLYSYIHGGQLRKVTIQLREYDNYEFVDVNGDNLTDFVYSTGSINHPYQYSANARVYLNNGSEWVSSDWTFPVLFTDKTSVDYTFDLTEKFTKFVDVNGDGLIDVVKNADGQLSGATNRNRAAVYLNTGHGWQESAQWKFPVIWTDSLGNPYTFSFQQFVTTAQPNYGNPTEFIDVNNDGLIDIVSGTGCPDTNSDCNGYNPGARTSIVLINTGNGWEKQAKWQLPTYNVGNMKYTTSFATSVYGIPHQLGDINGDALPDIVDSSADKEQCGSSASGYFRNTGSGWLYEPCWDLIKYSGNTLISRLADMNSDGLIDVVNASGVYSPSQSGINLNNGSKFVDSGKWLYAPFYDTGCNYKMTFAFYPPNNGCGYFDANAKIVDINGDGYPDMIQGSSYGIKNTFDGVYLNQNNNLIHTPSFNTGILSLSYNSFDQTGFVDINGDTLVDSVYANGCVTDIYSCLQGSAVYINQGQKPDIIAKIIASTGGEIEVDYSQQVVKNRAAQYVSQSNVPVAVVSEYRATTDNVTSTVKYEYYDGTYYGNATRPQDRKFAGFGVVKAESDSKIVINYYHQGNGISVKNNEPNDEYEFIGRVYRTEILDKQNRLMADTRNKYFVKNISGMNLVSLISSVQTSFDELPMSFARIYTHDDYGNVTRLEEADNVLARPNGDIVKKTNSVLRWTEFNYATWNTTAPVDLASKKSSFASTVRNYHPDGYMVGLTHYEYDDLPRGQVSKGLLSKNIRVLSDLIKISAPVAVSSYSYNAAGRVMTATDPMGNITTYVYDAQNLYPTIITNAAGHISTYTYDYRCGAPILIVDTNAVRHSKTFDGFCRQRTIHQTDPRAIIRASALAQNMQQFSYSDEVGNLSVTERVYYYEHEGDKYTTTYFDSWGRVVSKRTMSPNVHNNILDLVVVDTKYDAAGRILSNTLPYISSGHLKGSYNTDSNLQQTYVYDALDRPLIITTPDGVTTYSYMADRVVKTTDPNGNYIKHQTNGYGLLVAVHERPDDSIYTTTYGYDALNNLVSIINSEGYPRYFTYNGVGWRITATDLMNSAMAVASAYAYEYNANGLPVKITDPNGNVTTHTYNSLNQVSATVITGAVDNPKTIAYVYNDCQNGIGRLCKITEDSATTTYEYNLGGLVSKEIKIIDGISYITQYTYNLQGQIVTVHYPDRSTTTYTYNRTGAPTSVKHHNFVLPQKDIVSSVHYNPLGAPTQINYGNGIVMNNTYDVVKGYKLTQRTITTSAISGGEILESSALPTACETKNEIDLKNINDVRLSGVVKLYYNLPPSARTARLRIDDQPVDAVVASGRLEYIWNTTDGRVVNGLHKFLLTYSGMRLEGELTVDNFGECIEYETYDRLRDYTVRRRLPLRLAHEDRIQINFSPSGRAQSVTAQFTFDGVDYPILTQAPYAFEIDTRGLSGGQHIMSLKTIVDGETTISQAILTIGRTINVATPVITTESLLDSPVKLKISSETGTRVFYTLDGLEPTDKSQIYTQPLKISGSLTIKARAQHFTGVWSSTAVYGVVGTGPVSLSNTILDLKYEYDKVGNITKIIDNSDTLARRTTLYTYDKLNRLLSAITSDSRSAALNYAESYTYSPDGNLLTKNSNGYLTRYCYSGNQYNGCPYYEIKPPYISPDAVTEIQEYVHDQSRFATLQYDKNGNLLSTSVTGNKVFGEPVPPAIYTFDARNRLSTVNIGGHFEYYSYDNSGERLTVKNSQGTTVYVSDLYNTGPQGVVKNVQFNGEQVAVVRGSRELSVIEWTHNDHLGSAFVFTNALGVAQQALAYSPYGEVRLNHQNDDLRKQSNRQYLGEVYDNFSGLSYLNARHYDPRIGKFIQQDPVFWEVGLGGQESTATMLDPQLQNSYSYGRNNPVRWSDASGRCPACFYALYALAPVATAILTQASVGVIPSLVFSPKSTTETMTRLAPGSGDIIDATEVVTGNNVVTGEKLSGSERALTAVAAFVPYVSGSAARSLADGVSGTVKNLNYAQIAKQHNWGNSKTLQRHFDDHGADFGAKSVEEYARKTNGFILNNEYTHVFKEGTDTVYWNKDSQIAVFTRGDGAVSSGYKVTNENKINTYTKRIDNQGHYDQK